MVVRLGLWATGLGLVAAIAAGPANAQTPKKGGTLIYMIAADSPPSFDALPWKVSKKVSVSTG